MQMDVCSLISFPVNDVKNLHGFCMDTAFKSTYGLVGGFSVDELSYQATNFLNIQDDIDGVSGSIPPSHEKGVFQLKDEFTTHCSNAPSLPKRLKPVSAMKGSREKRGVGPPKKLTVKWGPDVYDPVPYLPLALDLVINRRPRKHGKKKGTSSTSSKENNNGSKSSSKSKGKDKKEGRKRSGKSSDMGF